MPKVTIREIDNTGSEEQTYLNHTVLIPGIKISKDTDTLDGLYTTVDEFTDKFKALVESNDLTTKCKDKSILMVCELLSSGLSVQYKGFYDSLDSNGAPVINTEVEDEIATIEEDEEVTEETGSTPAASGAPTSFTDFYKEFEDKGRYDLRFITTGAITGNVSTVAMSNAAMECAGKRGDAVAILSVPETCTTTSSIDEWTKSLVSANKAITRKGVSFSSSNEVYGKYAACFAPAVTVTLSTMLAEEVKDIVMPAGFVYLLAYAKSINNYDSWYAISGARRGSCNYVVTPRVSLGDSDVDILQTRSEDSGHLATNVICNIRPYGNILWGNRTLMPLSAPEKDQSLAVQLTASSFLNIRQLCCELKKTLYRAARQWSFEPNSDILWVNFKASITPLLEKMKTNQGIRGYKLIKVATNKKALLSAYIKITPIEAVEDFDLTVELNDTLDVSEETTI